MMLICSKITPAAGKEGAGGKEGSRRRGELKAACLPACLPESASPCYRTTAKSTATLWLGWASPASRQRPASTHPPGVWKEARNATWRLRMRIASLTNRLGKPSAKRLHGGGGRERGSAGSSGWRPVGRAWQGAGTGARVLPLLPDVACWQQPQVLLLPPAGLPRPHPCPSHTHFRLTSASS